MRKIFGKENITKRFNQETGIVFASEVASTLISSIGAAHYLGEELPVPVQKLKNFVARNIVSPHLETVFERHFGRQLHAEDIVQHGNGPLKGTPYKELSRSERVDRVARILTKESIVFLAETGLMAGAQYLLNSVTPKGNLKPGKVILTGAATQLGAMVFMGTVISKPSEWLYHKMTEMLPKITHMNQEKAKEFARHSVYVGFPGLLAFVAELAVADREHQKKR